MKYLLLFIVTSCTGMPLGDANLERERMQQLQSRNMEFSHCVELKVKNAQIMTLNFKVFNPEVSKWAFNKKRGIDGVFYARYRLDSSFVPSESSDGEKNLKVTLDQSIFSDSSSLYCLEEILKNTKFKLIDPRRSWEEVNHTINLR